MSTIGTITQAASVKAGLTGALKVLVTLDGSTAATGLSSILTALTLTHVVTASGQIVHGALERDVLATATVYDSTQSDGTNSYNVLIPLSAADLDIIAAAATEAHTFRVRWTWGDPVQTGGVDLVVTLAL